MNPLPIDVIIRTRDSATTLPAVFRCLAAQQGVECSYLIVDHGSRDGTLRNLPPGTRTIDYGPVVFNYSRALNLALPFLRQRLTLIISSHTLLSNPRSLFFAGELLLRRPDLASVCFSGLEDAELSVTEVDRHTFDGFNGTFNTAALFPAALLRERPFRTEVLSAEDQEWSRWALFERDLKIAHAAGCGTRFLNPRRFSLRKQLREWEYISAFADRSYLRTPFICSKLRETAALAVRGKFRSALYSLAVALILARTRLGGPRSTTSAYW